MRLRPHIVPMLALLALLVAPARSQVDSERVVRAWMDSQRETLSILDRVTVRADMQLTLTSGATTREVASTTLVSFVPGSRPDRTLERLRVDGRDLPPESEVRFERRLASMLGDDPGVAMVLGANAPGMSLPLSFIRSIRFQPTARLLELDGIHYVVLDGIPDLPEHRPPPPRDRPRRRGGPPPRMAAPEHGVSVWFRTNPVRLALVEHRVDLPRGQGFVINTEFERQNGLDLPARRSVSGDLPVARRLRMMTLQLDQRMAFMDYQLAFRE